MKRLLLSLVVMSIFIGFGIVEPAKAVPIVVVNSGFEDPALTTGHTTPLGAPAGPSSVVTDNPIPGWTVSQGEWAGVWNPSMGAYPGGNAPEGQNVAYSNGGGSGFFQILSTSLTSNTVYNLHVDVGNRLDVSFPGYTIQLLAGGNLLAEDNSSLLPTDGTFSTSTLTFATSFQHSHLGENLEIRLASLGPQVNFDNVRLYASETNPPIPSPEPSTLFLMGSGLVGLVTWRLRKKT